MELSFVSIEDTDSLYVPIPQSILAKNIKPVTVPQKHFVGSLPEHDEFAQMINNVYNCVTPCCKV